MREKCAAEMCVSLRCSWHEAEFGVLRLRVLLEMGNRRRRREHASTSRQPRNRTTGSAQAAVMAPTEIESNFGAETIERTPIASAGMADRRY